AIGDQLAFTAIYRKHWAKLYNSTYKRLPDHDQCCDVLQNIFSDLWTRREELKIQNLYAYLHGAVRFQVYKVVHREQRHTPFFDAFENLLSCPACDEEILEKELTDLLNAWMLTLPEKRRQIFKMRYELNLTTNEIASRLNISQKTVQNQLNTASNDLRTKLVGLSNLIIALQAH